MKTIIIIAGIIMLAFAVIFVGMSFKSEIEKRPPQPKTGPYEKVSTETVTLKPGEERLLPAFIGESGALDYQFEFITYSPESIIDYSRHGRNGEYGGDRVGGAGWCRPFKRNSITGDSSKNSNTFYLRIVNTGPDIVKFNFHLKGYRVLPQK